MDNISDLLLAIRVLRITTSHSELRSRGNAIAYLRDQIPYKQQLEILDREPLARVWYAGWGAGRQEYDEGRQPITPTSPNPARRRTRAPKQRANLGAP